MTSQHPRVQLNPQQQRAVDYEGSVTVVSGAGTGKTRVITERVRRIMKERDPNDHIVALTFTNRAAREMRDRLSFEPRVFLGTFHGFGYRILREFAEMVGLKSDMVVLDTTDQAAMVRRVMRDLDIHLPSKDMKPMSRKLAFMIGDAKAGAKELDEYDFHHKDISLASFEEIYRRYCDVMLRENKVDFTDLIQLPILILQKHKKVREELGGRYRYILVDELQDIDRSQLELLELLRADGSVFFGVGDDDQSIYRFRGADPKLMRRFANKFTDGEVIRLEHNYRSTEKILQLANAIIRKNRGRLGKELTSGISGGQLPVLTRYFSDEQEARDVARKINRLIEGHQVAPANIAVLYRNNAMSNLLEQALASFQIPFYVRGGMRFFERAEVKDLIAYLSVSNRTDDLAAFMRSVNMPRRSVGEAAKEDIADAVAAGKNLWDHVCVSSHPGVAAYRAIIEKIQRTEGLVAKVETAIEASGLREKLASTEGDEEKAENLGEVVSAAARFAEELGEEATLASFVSACSLDNVEKVASESVALLTIHSAKGLEFDHVFIIGLEDEIMPGGGDRVRREEVEEDCRLLYVAATRAGEALELSYTCMRSRWGSKTFPQRTRYLKGMRDKGLYEFVDLRDDLSARTSSGRGYARRPEPAAESIRSADGITTGMKVVSGQFGPGVVLRLQQSSDGNKASVLFFRDKKQRWLVTSMHELKPMQKSKIA